MQFANIHHAKSKLSELIRRAIAGEEVYIARADEPLVRLEPVVRDTRPRSGGQWNGRLTISDDFNSLDEEIAGTFSDVPLWTPPGGKQ